MLAASAVGELALRYFLALGQVSSIFLAIDSAMAFIENQ
jgi:hypothetical protein